MCLGGLAFVTYLTYVELFVIDAICVWCVATAAITALCFVVTVWEAVAAGEMRDRKSEIGNRGAGTD
jgi:uncharacterized membrane protein